MMLKSTEIRFLCRTLRDTYPLRAAYRFIHSPVQSRSKVSARLLLRPKPVNHHHVSCLSFWGSSSNVSEWTKAVSEAEKVVGYPTSFMSLRCLLSDELSNVAMQIRKLVGTRHPLLKTARKFFYDGKHSIQTRGLLVLLMSKSAGPSAVCKGESQPVVSGIFQSQRNLAEIIEMINTAHMIHKGVVNLSELLPHDGTQEDMHFGNKMSVLSGDFLLANASVGLAELDNAHVVELISGVIGDLVEGEFDELHNSGNSPVLPTGSTMADWEQHVYLSAGSLIGKSCKSAMILAGHDARHQEAALQFGLHTAYAHQLNEEIMPFLGATDNGSVPSVSSAPVILFTLRYPQQAKHLDLFHNPNVEPSLVRKTIAEHPEVLEETKDICRQHGQSALNAISFFPESDAKLALVNIVKAVTSL